MATYRFQSRSVVIVTAVVLAGFGVGLFAVLGLPVLLGRTAGPDGFRLALTTIGSLAFVLLGWGCLRQVCEIRMDERGVIEFARGLGARSIHARDIQSLEGQYFGSYNNEAIWQFRLRCSRGSFTFGEVDDAIDFVNRVRAHHPGVEIRGMWPIASPPLVARQPLQSRLPARNVGLGRVAAGPDGRVRGDLVVGEDLE